MKRRVLALLGSLGAIVLAFGLLVRPWYGNWGATAEEARRALPGDAIIPAATVQETRAITIAAPSERVWPWIAQLGQDRGGFYSYDLLENLVGCEMPTVDRLRPEKQSWHVGDKLWMYPAGKADSLGFGTLRTYLSGRALGFATRAVGTARAEPEDGSWSFVLVPVSATATRVLVRGRLAPGRSFPARLFNAALFAPAHFSMERRMLLGLKALVETGDRSRWINHLQVGLWAITLGLIGWSVVRVLSGRRWRRALAAFVAGCAVFQVLTLVQPALLLGAVLVTAVAVLLAPAPRYPILRAAAFAPEPRTI